LKQLFKIILPLIGIGKLLKYIFLGLFSGFCSFLFINAVTRVVALMMAGNFTSISREYIIVFMFIILVFIWARKTLSLAVVRISQTLFWKLRKDVLSIVLNANYQQLSSRKSNVHTAILNDVYVLTDASLSIIGFSSSVILAISCLIYMSTISLVLFSITLVIAILGATVYHLSSSRNRKQFQTSRKLETTFQENLHAILNGFKEIFIEPKKGKSIFENNINKIARESYSNNMSAYTGFINNQITGQVLFYVLISSILLVFSFFLRIKAVDTVSFVFTLLYLLGSIESIMVLLPGIMRARVASNHLMDLKKELEEANFFNASPEKYIRKSEFEQITVSNLEFIYGGDDKPFRIGPVSLEIQKGDVIFIYGGNGSGKTTLVHCILGLNIPSAGEIFLNGIPVNNSNYPYYRTLFSVVFSDFYLFNELHGLDKVDLEKWNAYVQLFELEDKVKIEGKSFSTTNLSAGQRKRLALIAALLEEKPILVIDEWAADQDPYFRAKFYTEIIPALKQDGVTIIAITHDDKFYYCADRLYKMNYGLLVEEKTKLFARSIIA
jgi:putative ATP-binding cassette transporter